MDKDLSREFSKEETKTTKKKIPQKVFIFLSNEENAS